MKTKTNLHWLFSATEINCDILKMGFNFLFPPTPLIHRKKPISDLIIIVQDAPPTESQFIQE